MEGICCLKGCGASIEDIKEYCRLCLLLQSEKNLKARYAIILKQRDKAYERLKKAEETVKYMESKVRHYEAVFSGLLPADTNPNKWAENKRPENHS